MTDLYDGDDVDRGGDGGEDFGYVKRDSALLEKALASRKSSAAEQDNNGLPRSSSSGSYVEREADVPRTSGPRPPTVDNSYPYRAEVNLVDHGTEQAKGILKPLPYDTKNKSTTRTEDELADLPKAVKKQSGLLQRMSVVSKTAVGVATSGPVKEDLPQMFQVKYLGYQNARGLWGIKHTRRPVDEMVKAAKGLKVGTVLPLVKLTVTKDGVVIAPLAKEGGDERRTFHSIDTISYGVQDLVYTRVFSMIVVKDTGGNARDVHPFECHAFVCESRHGARRLTYSLASAFQEYSRAVNSTTAGSVSGKEKVAQIKKRFAIDLRSPDEIEADLEEETEA